MSRRAQLIYNALSETEWMGVRAICVAADLIYVGEKYPNWNRAYISLKELMRSGKIEKRVGHDPRSPRYTEYRKLNKQ